MLLQSNVIHFELTSHLPNIYLINWCTSHELCSSYGFRPYFGGYSILILIILQSSINQSQKILDFFVKIESISIWVTFFTAKKNESHHGRRVTFPSLKTSKVLGLPNASHATRQDPISTAWWRISGFSRKCDIWTWLEISDFSQKNWLINQHLPHKQTAWSSLPCLFCCVSNHNSWSEAFVNTSRGFRVNSMHFAPNTPEIPNTKHFRTSSIWVLQSRP